MKRNKFSLSHFKLQSCTMGQLVPLTWFEVLPGDTVQQSTHALIRCAPLVTPPMHPCHVRIHHFFVPNRIIWQGTNPTGSDATGGWENFITGGANGLDATVHPYISFSSASANSLSDYLGLPLALAAGPININALPFRAYNLIWNEYFRDEDLQTRLTVSTADGQDTTSNTAVQNVCWQKDYYTTARPWEAKGPTVGMFKTNYTMGIFGLGIVDGTVASNSPAGYRDTSGFTGAHSGVQTTSAGVWALSQTTGATGSSNTPTIFGIAGPNTSFAGAQTADINDLRRQFALQRFQEARAKYGSRYVEYLRYLGIRSSDARLQRPEYLGGGTSTIQFSEVLQTSNDGTAAHGVPGQLYGHGITAQRTNRYRRFFEEHGIVMSLMSVRPITVYTNPVRRAWFRGMTNASGAAGAPAGMLGTREDYFTRELQGIGQQIISQAEVEAATTATSLVNTFGYQDRYDEYRRMESQVTGQFRGGGGALNNWHFARSFATAPTLNATFVSSVPSVLPFADQAHDTLYVMANHSIQARRMIQRVGGGYAR